MYLYVKSAGTIVDYGWAQCQGAPTLPALVEKWNDKLNENDLIFALLAGKCNQSWHVIFRNLRLPGRTDNIAGRPLMLNLYFSGLSSEKEVRALALSYLDLEVQTDEFGDCLGRFNPTLAAAYQPTPDGNYSYDYDSAIRWAQQEINRTLPKLGDNPPTTRISCRRKPDDIEQLKERLRTTALSDGDGLKLIASKIIVLDAEEVDISLRYSETACTWKEEPLPSDKAAGKKETILSRVIKNKLDVLKEKFQPNVVKEPIREGVNSPVPVESEEKEVPDKVTEPSPLPQKSPAPTFSTRFDAPVQEAKRMEENTSSKAPTEQSPPTSTIVKGAVIFTIIVGILGLFLLEPQKNSAPDISHSNAAPLTLPSSKLKELRDRAREGNVVAMQRLGKRLIQGDGVDCDTATGAEWMRRSADGGDSEAMLWMGDLHHQGKGVPQNINMAMQYWQAAAKAGNKAARKRLEQYGGKPAATTTTPAPATPPLTPQG
ncbi:MAG: hypothetical protein Q4F35_08180 [Akkermansia sp.]|nr:hypothetical protein [Akkermansia sp.]